MAIICKHRNKISHNNIHNVLINYKLIIVNNIHI